MSDKEYIKQLEQENAELKKRILSANLYEINHRWCYAMDCQSLTHSIRMIYEAPIEFRFTGQIG